MDMEAQIMDKENHVVPVILCGGSGTRLWPLSRKLYPKQFVNIGNGQTLFTQTLQRVRKHPFNAHPVIVSNEDYRFYVIESLEQLNMEAEIIFEPAAKNTAPALALAALAVLEKADALMLVMPSDHYFEDEEEFYETIARAVPAAAAGHIVTFGVKPGRPEQGYGYIHCSSILQENVFKVSNFVEKPDAASARQMLNSDEYFWNSGIFLMPASVYLKELGKFAPQILEACLTAWQDKSVEGNFMRPGADAFRASPGESVDYAVMEKTLCAVMLPLCCGWNDMGSWDSFFQIGTRDESGNVSVGDVLLQDVENSYIHAQRRLIAAVGVKDIAVVESGDAVLVLPRQQSQKVKQIVGIMEKQEREEFRLHPLVYRPWGSYERLAMGGRFQVKRIIVKPGGALSLQMHHHRSEHWIIVRGTAEITIGDASNIYTENQSVYIPLGGLHRLRNPGKINLELIEVQSGSYLGEDDINRFDDDYRRN